MKTSIQIENIKCGGCVNSIRRTLASLNGVFGVSIDIESGEVTIDHTDEVIREQLAAKLLSMGYPEVGTVKGFAALKAGAKSYISCTIGRMDSKK